MGYYATKQLKPWLYTICDPGNAFLYLIVGEKRALLYDTGYGTAPILPTIKEITGLDFDVVLGHGHLDHANGANQFEFAWIGAADTELCLRHTSRTARKRVLERIENEKTALPPNFDAENYVQNSGANLKSLSYGQTFDLGSITAEVIDMAGHTAGSRGLLIKEKRMLFASDAVSQKVYMFLAESTSVAEYLSMLRRVRAMPFDTFFWAHESVEYNKDENFAKFIAAAENIDINKSKPFDFPGRDAKIYRDENGMAVIFSEDKL